MTPDQKRRVLTRGSGIFAVVLGLSFLANALVMLLGGGASVIDEAPYLIPAALLLGLGGFLLSRSGR